MDARRNIVLIGFMGCGKSSVGRIISRRLGFEFLDTDELIEQRDGRKISAIFAEEGEARFREIETATLASLRGLQNHVIATGGGIVVRPENHALLRELGFVARLKASPETIMERVGRSKDRPLMQTADPLATIVALLSAREELYAAAAEYTVDNTRLSHTDSAAEIIAAELRNDSRAQRDSLPEAAPQG